MLPATVARAVSLAVLGLTAAFPALADPRLRPLPGTRAEAATLIVQGIAGGPLPVAVLAPVGALEAADEPSALRLPIVFEVPAAALPVPAAAAPTYEFYVYALTPAGAVAAHLGLALDREATPLAARAGMRLVTSLDLPPGDYSLRLLVLEPVSHRFGLRILDVTVPADHPPAALTAPTIDNACSGWLLATTPRAPRLTAAARPVLVIGGRVELSSALFGFGESVPAIRVRLEPTNAESTEPHTLAAELIARGPAAVPAESLRLAFDLPPIARGVYQLSLELDGGASSLASAPTEVWVVDEGDLGASGTDPCDRTWSAVIARSGGRRPAPPAVARREPTAEELAGRRRLRRAYIDMLREFAASGDVEAASRELCELEKKLGRVQTGLHALLRVEVEVARRLAATEPEILPALMLLHHQAYLEHLRREQYPLAGHSGRAVKALAELLVDRSGGEESRRLASDILTSLAEYGHRNRMLVPSQLLLRSALEMNPRNEDALLLLAVNYEWLGRYEEATRRLEQILESQATNSEAKLRLAIMRRRHGDLERAERDLRRILREGAPPWLLSLTYQALVRLLREQERDAEALELLSRARDRLGPDQRLQLLEALAFERTGRPDEARQRLRELRIEATAPSPRYRYGQSLTSPLASLREGVARGVAVRLPLLTRAFEEEASR